MRFDWSKYLIVAQELADQATAFSDSMHMDSLDEAKLRSAISRAYYGAFRQARNYLCDNDGQSLNALLKGNTHQNVINLFDRNNNIDYQIIAQLLCDLRSARNKADYDDMVPNLLGLAMTSLLQSEQIIDVLKTLTFPLS
jgi:uncharacterized protein (UPF0332 family)